MTAFTFDPMTPGTHSNPAILLRTDAAAREVIDVNDGIDRVMGDRDLYDRMLRRFRQDYMLRSSPIGSALATGDRTLAHRMVHTLKGSSGMIGARALHGQTCALERAIRTSSGAESRELERMEAELLKVMTLLDDMLEENHGTLPTRALLDDASMLSTLEQLLDSGDGAAIDLLEEAGPSLRIILGEDAYADVLACAGEFDFAGALARVRR